MDIKYHRDCLACALEYCDLDTLDVLLTEHLVRSVNFYKRAKQIRYQCAVNTFSPIFKPRVFLTNARMHFDMYIPYHYHNYPITVMP